VGGSCTTTHKPNKKDPKLPNNPHKPPLALFSPGLDETGLGWDWSVTPDFVTQLKGWVTVTVRPFSVKKIRSFVQRANNMSRLASVVLLMYSILVYLYKLCRKVPRFQGSDFGLIFVPFQTGHCHVSLLPTSNVIHFNSPYCWDFKWNNALLKEEGKERAYDVQTVSK